MKKVMLLIFVGCCSFAYSPDFTKSMGYVLKFEGGYTMIDPGGTNFGIRQCNYDIYRHKNKLLEKDVRLIPMAEVYDLYWHNYYKPSGADTLPPALSFVHFDSAVNCGVTQAGKFIRKVGTKNDKENAKQYIKLRDGLYRWLAKNKGKQAFLKGWLNRDQQILEIIIKNY